MPVLREWSLELTVDQVLRAQGADPAAIRARKPALVEIAEWALQEGLPLLQPAVVYQVFDVLELRHQRLQLDRTGKSAESRPSRLFLSGPLVAEHLAAAEKVVIMVCTVGSALEEVVSELIKADPLHGLALDGLGTAAVETLAVTACNGFEAQAEVEGLQTTLPLSPGMIGWPTEAGQRQIFALLDTSEIGVALSESQQMLPRKTLSLVLGQGRSAGSGGQTCDYCSVKETCRYRESEWKRHYA